MNAKILTCSISLIVITSILIFSGCVEEDTQSQIDLPQKSTPEEPPQISATKEPFELALQLSDFSSNFTIKERTERLKSDVSQEGLDIGWKKGYHVMFIRIGDSLFDATSVIQTISIYPTENITKTITFPKLNTDYITYEELSKPNIGDDSRAYRITYTDEYGYEERAYEIEFIKLDVYESLIIGGAATDFELLRDIAMKAEAKIK
jgi:hypothetical protein